MNASQKAKKGNETSAVKYRFLWALMANPELSPSAKCVALVLMFKFRNTRTGQCNPSFAAIGEKIGRQRRVAIDAVKELKDAGWLTVNSSHGGSPTNTSHFLFNFERPQPVRDTAPPPVQEAAPVPNTAPVRENVEGVRNTAHEPSKNHSLPSEEREGVRASARAPDGALSQLGEKFESLYQLWQRPHGTNKLKACKAFVQVCADHEGDDVIASAARWVAGVNTKYLPRLEDWLANGAWKNQPPAPDNNQRRGGKRSGADVAMEICRDEFEREGFR